MLRHSVKHYETLRMKYCFIILFFWFVLLFFLFPIMQCFKGVINDPVETLGMQLLIVTQ